MRSLFCIEQKGYVKERQRLSRGRFNGSLSYIISVIGFDNIRKKIVISDRIS